MILCDGDVEKWWQKVVSRLCNTVRAHGRLAEELHPRRRLSPVCVLPLHSFYWGKKKDAKRNDQSENRAFTNSSRAEKQLVCFINCSRSHPRTKTLRTPLRRRDSQLCRRAAIGGDGQTSGWGNSRRSFALAACMHTKWQCCISSCYIFLSFGRSIINNCDTTIDGSAFPRINKNKLQREKNSDGRRTKLLPSIQQTRSRMRWTWGNVEK